MLVPTVFSGQLTRGLTLGHLCLKTQNSVPRIFLAGGGIVPNKFLTTQCSIRRTGLNSKFAIAWVVQYRVTRPYGLNICSVNSETITDIFHPYVRVSSPSHRVGLVNLFPLPQGREWVPRKKRFLLGGMAFILGLPVPVNARNVP